MQRRVELLGLAELRSIQRRLGLVQDNVRWRGPEPTVDKHFDGLAWRTGARFAKDAGQATAYWKARLATRGEARQELAHGIGKCPVHWMGIVSERGGPKLDCK